MPCAVVAYQGREVEGLYGGFETEEDALDWCAKEGIEVGAAILDDDQRRGLILPLNPPD